MNRPQPLAVRERRRLKRQLWGGGQVLAVLALLWIASQRSNLSRGVTDPPAERSRPTCKNCFNCGMGRSDPGYFGSAPAPKARNPSAQPIGLG